MRFRWFNKLKVNERIDYSQSMQKLDIKDGDVIILKCKQRLSPEDAEHMMKSYRKVMKDFRVKDVKVLILGDGIDIGVITKGVKGKSNG